MNSFTVGRGEQADLKLTDDSVSRVHLRVTVLNQQQCLVEDLESSNGTFRLEANGARTPLRLEQVTLDQILLLGTFKIRLRDLIAAYWPGGVPSTSLIQPLPERRTENQEPFSRYVRTEDGRYVKKGDRKDQ